MGLLQKIYNGSARAAQFAENIMDDNISDMKSAYDGYMYDKNGESNTNNEIKRLPLRVIFSGAFFTYTAVLPIEQFFTWARDTTQEIAKATHRPIDPNGPDY